MTTSTTTSEDRENSGETPEKKFSRRESRFRAPSEVYYFTIYTALTILFTYPIAFRPTATFYGLPEDPLTFQWFFWYLARKGGWGPRLRAHCWISTRSRPQVLAT